MVRKKWYFSQTTRKAAAKNAPDSVIFVLVCCFSNADTIGTQQTTGEVHDTLWFGKLLRKIWKLDWAFASDISAPNLHSVETKGVTSHTCAITINLRGQITKDDATAVANP